MTTIAGWLNAARVARMRTAKPGAVGIPVALMLGLASPVASQNVLHLPDKSIEVIGLRDWTIPMLQDSLAKYAPGESLTSHACAAVLRYKLGFPDAVAFSYAPWAADSVERIVVAVVEPSDSGRVAFSNLPLDTAAPRQDWADAIDLFRRSRGVQYTALRLLADREQALEGHADASVEAYSTFLAEHADPADRDTALAVLANDPDYRNRTVAASILANFVDEDPIVWALADALLESDGPVKTTAASVLESLVATHSRTVDWTPAAKTVHKVLNGTSLPVLTTLMEVLVATGADPGLAIPLLRGGGEGVLTFLSAQHPHLQGAAHRLLTALRGEDLGLDVLVWRMWIERL